MKKFILREWPNYRSRKKHIYLCCSVILLLAFFSSLEAKDKSSNSIEKWIGLLQSLEDQVRVVEYDVECTKYFAYSKGEFDNPTPTGLLSKTHVLAESGTGRLHRIREGIDGVIDSPEKRLASHKIEAFDGESYMNLLSKPKGANFGDYYKPTGTIDSDRSAFGSMIRFQETGLYNLYPGFYEEEGIIKVLKKAEEVKIIEKTSGLLELHYLEKRALPGKKNDWWRKIVLDLNKQGVITQDVKYIKVPNDPKEYPNIWTNIEYTQTSDGTWIPQNAVYIAGAIDKRKIWKLKYNNFKINHIDPDQQIERFRIKFPFGTPVVDRRLGLRYVVGSTSIQKDVLASLDEVLEKRPEKKSIGNIKPEISENENNSITENMNSDFPQADKSKSDIDKSNLKRPVKFSYKWLLLGIPLFIIILYLMVRKKNGKSFLFLTAVFLLVPYANSYGKLTILPVLKKANTFEVNGPGNETIPVYQCGLNCTLFALEFFNKTYSLDMVKNELSTDPNGISLWHIKNVVQSHGLNVNARHLANVKYLSNIFKEKTLLVVPVLGNNPGHFYIALPAEKENGNSRYFIVEPGFSVSTIGKEEMSEKFLKAGGTLLILSEEKKSSSQADRIRFEPEDVNFGKFLVSASSHLQKKISLRNIGDYPIMISHIVSSCSCSSAEWQGGIVYPHTEKNLIISMSPEGWGIGKKKKTISFICGDGTVTRCIVKGEGITTENSQKISVTPKKVYFNLSSSGRTDGLTRKIYIHKTNFHFKDPVQINTDNSAPWLNVQIVNQPAKETVGLVEIKLNPALLSSQTSTTRFAILTDEKEPPITISVQVLREKTYSISPSFIFLDDNSENKSQNVFFKPDGINTREIKIIKTLSQSPSINTVYKNYTDGTSMVEITSSLSRKEGIHDIEVQFELDAAEKVTEIIHVFVPKS